MKRHPHELRSPRHVLLDHLRRHPDHPIPPPPKLGVPPSIRRGAPPVIGAVYLHHEPRLGRGEVDDEAPDDHLAAKGDAELASAEDRPEELF